MYIPFDNKYGCGEHKVVEEEEGFHLDTSLHNCEGEIPGRRS